MNKSNTIFLKLTTFIVGICSILYELLISTSSSYFLGNSVLQFSIIIGFYLASMGVGSYMSRWIQSNKYDAFILIEIILGLVGAFSVPLIYIYFAFADYTNFKDTLIRDTLIIDTILVEKIDGSNCHLAADGFCDTKPDYLYTRWSCTSTNAISQQVQTDPNGEKFQSDGTLIMSYADDKCAARFSEEQMAAMRANFLNEKSQLNYGQVPRNAITSFNIDHIKPFYEETVNYQNINLQWSQVENADYYLVQFSKYSQFSIISLDTIVENNEMLVPQLENDSKWYWRVMPFNAYNFDIQFSNGSLFFTSEMVSTSELSSTIKAWPNPVLKGEFNISLDHNEKIENIEVYDISGRHILLDMNINGSMASIETKNLNMGVFIVRINTDKQYYTLRMMVE